MVLGQLAAGRTVDEVIADYPYVERDDVLAAVKYAAAAVKEPEVPDVGNTRPDRASLRTSDPARVRRRHVRRPTSADSGDVDANPILLLRALAVGHHVGPALSVAVVEVGPPIELVIYGTGTTDLAVGGSDPSRPANAPGQWPRVWRPR
jgi:hypothetical protein